MLDFFLRKMSILIEINGRVASQIILVYSDMSHCRLSEKQKKDTQQWKMAGNHILIDRQNS